MANFHTENIASLLHKFGTDMNQGLTAETLRKSLAQHGRNEIRAEKNRTALQALYKPILSWRVAVLGIATAVLGTFFAMGITTLTWYPTAAVGLLFALHLLFGYITEYRIQSRDRHHNHLMRHRIQVVRQGKIETRAPEEIVPGDLLHLRAGNYIPADARLIEAEDLTTDESALFGTDEPIQKSIDDLSDATADPQHQHNMVFGGTYIVTGTARAIVVKTGKQLEMWKDRHDSRPPRPKATRAENETRGLYNGIKITGLTAGGIAIAIAWWFEYQNQTTDWTALIHLAALFAIAAAPQDALQLLRLLFSKHAEKLAEKGIVLRDSRSFEKLTRITAFFSNEKGLSTTRTLRISNLFVNDQLLDAKTWETCLNSLAGLPPDKKQPALEAMGPIPQAASHLVFTAGLGISDPQGSGTSSISPQSTLQENMTALGYAPETTDAGLPSVKLYPATSNYPYQMQVFQAAQEEYLNVICGDARTVLDTCGEVLINGEITGLSDNRYQTYQDVIDYLLSTKADVYGVAFHVSDVVMTPQEMEYQAAFLGFISFSTHNDEQTRQVLRSSQETGLKIILISENSEQETVDLGRELGVIYNRSAAASKETLEAVPRDELDTETAKWLAYSQPTQEQRRNIVLSLKRQGHGIGFLGETREDLRAMTVADMTFANQAEASHAVQAEAAGLIYKGGFQAVRDALLHVREAYHNAAAFLRWNLSCTLSLLLTLTLGTALHYLYKMPMPLTLTQILWTQFLLTLLPSLVIGTERIFADEKHHRPTLFSGTRFLTKTTNIDIVCRAVTVSLMTIIPFLFILWRSTALPDTLGAAPFLQDALAIGSTRTPDASDIARARTAACTTLIFTQFIACWQALRYPWESLFHRIGANARLLAIFISVAALHLITLYTEPISTFLGMTPLLWEWQWTLLFSLILLLLPLNLAISSQLNE